VVLSRQAQHLPHLDHRTLQAVGALDVDDPGAYVVRRVMSGRDGPERVTWLDDDGGVGLNAASERDLRQADAEGQDGSEHERPLAEVTPSATAARAERTDSVARSVHLFAKRYRTGVRLSTASNKGLHCPANGASMADSVPPLRPGDDTKLTDQLTERQTKILDYIRYVTRIRNYPPSVREIGEAVGLSSSSTVHNHLNQLERRGLIKRDPSKSRTVQLVQDAELDNQRRNAVAVPIVGNVAAGVPILAEQKKAFLRQVRGQKDMVLDVLLGQDGRSRRHVANHRH
jgi:predicted transcriptional regulator